MLEIRDATIADCGACAELGRIEELRPALGDDIPERYYRAFVDDDRLFFIAQRDAQIIGFILGEPLKGGLAQIGLLTVAAVERGRGIGRQLVERFRERCDDLGIGVIVLYAPSFNEKTLAFYRGCGFVEGKAHIQFLEARR